MSPTERHKMIRKENTDLSLAHQCALLKNRRSSIYFTLVGMNAETLKLMLEIDRVFTKYPLFGSRQITAYFPQSGFSVGRHRVRRLMNIKGLQAIYRAPYISKKHPQHRIFPYLPRKPGITQPNQDWCSNITYIPVKRGFLYLMAIAKDGKPEIMNTDQGGQYTGAGWVTTLTKANIRISMDGRGRYLDNIFIERLWRSPKQEAIYLHEITDGFQAKRTIVSWIGFYNPKRPHTALGKHTPDTSCFGQTEALKAPSNQPDAS